jgi:hypothetical protein
MLDNNTASSDSLMKFLSRQKHNHEKRYCTGGIRTRNSRLLPEQFCYPKKILNGKIVN